MATVTRDIKLARRHVGPGGVADMKHAAHRAARRAAARVCAEARYDVDAAESLTESPRLTGRDIS